MLLQSYTRSIIFILFVLATTVSAVGDGRKKFPLRFNIKDACKSLCGLPNDHPKTVLPNDSTKTEWPVSPDDSAKTEQPVSPDDSAKTEHPISPNDTAKTERPVSPDVCYRTCITSYKNFLMSLNPVVDEPAEDEPAGDEPALLSKGVRRGINQAFVIVIIKSKKVTNLEDLTNVLIAARMAAARVYRKHVKKKPLC